MLKPLFKWTGGKRREIKVFEKYYPEIVKSENYTFIEPFVGGGAVYWDLQAPNNIINDIDYDLTNFFEVIKNSKEYIIESVSDIGDALRRITDKEKSGKIDISEAKKERGEYYYHWRNMDRENGLDKMNPEDRACRFFIVNQLAFNGMRRFNKSGEFNVPYGNYKQLNLNLTGEHLDLLNRTEVLNKDYRDIMLENDREDVFIYLDPPYTRKFKEYNHKNVFGYESQLELCNIFKGMENAKVMLIINKDDFTTELYSDYIKDEYSLKYSTNIKNRYSKAVKHLIITNY